MKHVSCENRIPLVTLGNIIILNLSRHLRFSPASSRSKAAYGRIHQGYGQFVMQQMSNRSLF